MMAFKQKRAASIVVAVVVTFATMFVAISAVAQSTHGASASAGTSTLATSAPTSAAPAVACGQTSVALGQASGYAILSGTTPTNTGPVITGNIGVGPGSAIDRFPTGK